MRTPGFKNKHRDYQPKYQTVSFQREVDSHLSLNSQSKTRLSSCIPLIFYLNIPFSYMLLIPIAKINDFPTLYPVDLNGISFD